MQNDGNNDDSETRMVTLKVPYRGEKGTGMLKGLTKYLHQTLPSDVRHRIVQTGTKLLFI